MFAADSSTNGLSPQEEWETFHFADPHLAIELVAAEPDVVSPVAIAWDADGRMFVAEMSDYPTGPKVGRIRMLEDRDGDGRYERATVFADGLSFPNGVLPWNDGVLVTAAPDILFLRDTDGDGRADDRRVLLTGFGQGNQQLRVNGLLWGLDNWIYGANGRSEGEIRRPEDPPAKAVSIRGHDFRFRPDTGEIEAIAGRSQFGLARDDWGNRFLSWNTIAMRQEVLAERYLTRNPRLASTESVFDTAPPGETGRVFPLTPPPLTFNNESTSHFNALAGLTIYRGEALGPGYRGSAFMGETLRNLVHRRVLEGDGPRFTARREDREQEQEFLASTDPWFHPVNFATGPDGALYVVDFYRRFVEHPDFVPAKLRGDVAWRSGAEHGRLWRIVVKNTGLGKQAGPAQLRAAATTQLVAHLSRSNGWWRDTAQRLLVERKDRAAVPLLAAALRTNAPDSPLAQLHALGALDGLGALTPELLIGAMTNPHFAVRARATLLSEPFLSGKRGASAGADAGRLREALFVLAADRDARVRLQLVLTLGEMAYGDQLAALTRLTRASSFIERWESTAILSSIGNKPWPFLKALLREDLEWLRRLTVEQRRFLEQTARLVGAGHTEAELEEFFAQFAAVAPALQDRGQVALLAGLGDGLARSGQSLEKLLKAPPAALEDKVPAPSWLAQAPANVALSTQEKSSDRLAGIRLLTLARPGNASAALLRLLEPGQPDELQGAAARGFMDVSDEAALSHLYAQWTDQAPRARRHLLAAVSTPVAAARLLDALEAGRVQTVELDVPARQALKKMKDAAIQSRAERIFNRPPASDREGVVRRHQPALAIPGDRTRGAALFARTCLACHSVQGQGQRVGPDLSGAGVRPKEALLVDILDPSRQVSPDFISYTVTTAGGETLSGLIAEETATTVTLRRANLPDEALLRSQIKELRADGKSLMPDGLEEGMSQQDVADLLEFLRQPDAALFPKEK